MFDEKSLNQLRGVIREEVREAVRVEVPDLVRDVVRTEVHDVVHDVVYEVVRKIVRVEVRAQIHEVVSVLLNEIIMPQFEYIHARIDRLEAIVATKADIQTLNNQYVSKSYLEDRLDTFRIDHGLKYKKA